MAAVGMAVLAWGAYLSPFWPSDAEAQPEAGTGTPMIMDDGMASVPATDKDYMSQLNESIAGLKGDALDEAFLKAMIVRHEGAVAMAQEIMKSTKRQELKDLAEGIITGQAAEIVQMRQWLRDWY
jgi:uncharacterized protein (DUF305 family)